MQTIRNRCVQMMKVDEEELKAFGRQRVVEKKVSEEAEMIHDQAIQEYIEAERIIGQARKKYEKNEWTNNEIK